MTEGVELLSILESLSEALVLSDADNVQAMSEIHTKFQEFTEKAADLSMPAASKISSAAADLVEKIVLQELEDIDSALETLTQTATCLQMLAEGRDIKTIKTPPGLDVEIKEKENEEKSEGTENAPSSEDNIQEKDNSVPEDTLSTENMSAIAAEPELVADFINESTEHLEACDGHLLSIENDPGDTDALNAVFRAFHTIKGVSSFLNLPHVRDLAHKAENLLDKARCGEIELSGISMDIIFESVDMMKQMVEDLGETFKSGSPANSVTGLAGLISRLSSLTEHPDAPEEKQETVQGSKMNKAIVSPNTSFPTEIIIGELPQLIEELNEHLEIADDSLLKLDKTNSNPEALNSLFRSFHTIKGSSSFLGLTPIENLAHHAESLLDKARTGVVELQGSALDAVFETVDAFKQIVDELKNIVKEGAAEIAISEYSNLCDRLEKFANPSKSKESPEKGTAQPEPPLKSTVQELKPASVNPPKSASNQKVTLKDTVKVDSERLDKLLDAIGELVIAETMVTQSNELKSIASPHLVQNISHLDKITRELQEMSTSLRMVPLQSTFQKMARLVRDLSKKIGKDVEFIIKGEKTELDKTVVDRIGDPLVHMVRNAIDHGIESDPDKRRENGKPEKGKISLRAFHKGGNIYIEIEDDGKGLDKNAIFAKAVERGIVDANENLSEKEIYSLIFSPGFSTAESITEVSGRGVGMDVVKKNIEALRGQIDIQSEPGKGSVFSIKLPLTLAIIDGMVAKVCSERYIIPTLSIVMSVSVRKNHIDTIQKKGEMLSLQNELIPVFHLEKIFELEQKAKNDADEYLVVVIEEDGMKTGIIIDELLGQQQIVIKNLGEFLKGSPGISGGAIMPDGSVGLILDVSGLVRLANSNA